MTTPQYGLLQCGHFCITPLLISDFSKLFNFKFQFIITLLWGKIVTEVRIMDATEKIKFLLDEKGWSAYRLSKECGLSVNTILTMLKRNSVPSITTLEAICKAFGITISEFFADGELIEVPTIHENC